MNNFSFLKRFLFAVAVLLVAASCDDDFDLLGSDVIDGDIHSGMHQYYGHALAYDRATGAVQTSGMSLNLLGVLNNPVFGTTTASYVTDVQLGTTNPSITSNMVVDSAWVYVPYYSTLENSTTDEDGDVVNTYSLDSIYGDTTSQYSLKIRRNNYYLRSTDPSQGGTSAQVYYNDATDILNHQTTTLLAPAAGSTTPQQSVTTGFSNAEIKRTASFTDDEGNPHDVVAETLAPGLFQYLDNETFRAILQTGKNNNSLTNASVFKDYFRGVSFTAEAPGNVAGMPQFANGYITIIYSQDDLDSAGEVQLDDDGNVVRETITLKLNLKGSNVNILQNQDNPDYAAALATANTTTGDDKLYLKGGQGSMAMIDVLSAEDVAFLQSENALINEANLSFYIDQETMANATREPLRIYLYDVNNKQPLYDYAVDGTSSTSFPKYGKYVHGGILEKDASGKGYRYRIRITNHINNIISTAKDSANVKLGLVVTETINTTSNGLLKTPFTEEWAGGLQETPSQSTVNVKNIPMGSVIHPFGTVLYGTGAGVPEDKRLKLEIYYTKPDETN